MYTLSNKQGGGYTLKREINVRRMFLGLGFLFAIFCVATISAPTSIRAEDDVEVTTVEELNDEVSSATTEEKDITIADDIGSGSVVISSGQDIVFDTNQDSVTFNSSITINEGGKLTLNGNVNYQQRIINYGALIINGGVFNNTIRNSGSNATFEMNDGEITGVSIGDKSGAVILTNGATGTMNGGSIHDNTITNQYSGAVLVENNASFTMNDGSISNNSTGTQINTSGGVMVRATAGKTITDASEAKTATFIMNGGTISYNSAPRGAGVHVWGGSTAYYFDFYSKATFVMNGGTISNNKATGVQASYGYLGGAGGGVYVYEGAEFTMNDGSIINNTVIGSGGGVATLDDFVEFFGKVPYSSVTMRYYDLLYSDWYKFFPASFIMNGGTISGNSAYLTPEIDPELEHGTGGGVYVGSANVYINAGLIENNTAEKNGGAFYVGSVPYVLHINDVLITDNSASSLGGGIWNCPTGSIIININSAAAVFDNVADGAGDDIVVLQPDSYEAITTLADRILGGGLANWTKDGGIALNSGDYGWSSGEARYNPNGENVTYTNIENSLEVYSLKSVPTDFAKTLAESVAKVIIRNNTAVRGGGIGSNGTIVLGEIEEQPYDYSVLKVWADGSSPLESITIWLVTDDGQKVQSAILSAENNWSYVFTGLATNVSYKIVEEDMSGWKASYEVNGLETIITNTPDEPEEPNYPDGGRGDDEEPEEPEKEKEPEQEQEQEKEEPKVEMEVQTSTSTNEMFMIILLVSSLLGLGFVSLLKQ